MYTIYPPLEMIRFWQEEARERRRQRDFRNESGSDHKESRARKRPATTRGATSEDVDETRGCCERGTKPKP
jgi:hypothetical protein